MMLRRIIKGQTEISYPDGKNKRLNKIFYKPEVFLFRDAAEAIRNADKIVICPGELYGSIVPNLIVSGMAQALKESSAMKVYVCNLVTKEGNYEFKADDFVKEIEKYAGISVDKIIINSKIPEEAVLKKYLDENSRIVEDNLGEDKRVIRGDFIEVYPQENKTLIRHVPDKIAKEIIALR